MKLISDICTADDGAVSQQEAEALISGLKALKLLRTSVEFAHLMSTTENQLASVSGPEEQQNNLHNSEVNKWRACLHIII